MKLPRRRFLHLAAGAAALPAVSRFAWAQAYPTRPVRMIVGFAAGGPADILARLMGQWLSERLGQPFVIENRPGAGSNIGTEAVVRAPADGYTLLMVGASATRSTRRSTTSSISISSATSRRSRASSASPNVMVVNPSFPAKTVPEFIAYAKANPGKINMASGGNGTASHVAGELFKMMTGVDMVHVPYRGAAPRSPTCSADRCRSCSTSCPRRSSTFRAGKLRAAGGDHRDAFGGAAGHPDRGRIRAGLRGELGVWHWCAQEHASRDRR